MHFESPLAFLVLLVIPLLMGFKFFRIKKGSIRFSMGRFTTRDEIEYTVSVLPEIIDRLRSMSATYNKAQ